MAKPLDDTETSTPSSFYISQASTQQDLVVVADIFAAYTRWLDEDLTFQNYATELAGLPGKYGPPSGALLLARNSVDGDILGCIALRPLELQPEYQTEKRKNVRLCELKRLYTYPAARGRGVARALVRAAIAAAEKSGYQEILLDTLSKMVAAIPLYKTEGFTDTEPYYHSPLTGVMYMAKKLQ